MASPNAAMGLLACKSLSGPKSFSRTVLSADAQALPASITAYLLLLMMTWANKPGTRCPSISVMFWSALLGVGLPLGWLCSR